MERIGQVGTDIVWIFLKKSVESAFYILILEAWNADGTDWTGRNRYRLDIFEEIRRYPFNPLNPRSIYLF